jgi:multidrug resistance protein MdtO
MDTATPFLLVIAAVSFLAAWVSRSAHFGYIGLQIALSFFYVAFEGFSASTQMAPARDRLMGILLALVVMLLVFRPEKGVEKMRQTFAHLLQLQAEYLQATAFHVPASTRRLKAIELRERMERLVESARGFAEMMQYEFSRKREQHVQISEEIEQAISISGDLLLSINSWPHESNFEENNSLAQQSRTALETGLHSLSDALIEKPDSVEETPVQPFHLPEAAPLHIANTLSIYNDLTQQCRQIALSYAE